MVNQYLLQLMLAKGIGDAAIRKILQYASVHEACSLQHFCEEPAALGQVLNLKGDTIRSIPDCKLQAQKLWGMLQNNDVSVITEQDEAYPSHLKKVLHDHNPPVLFVQGNPALLSTPSVGFCGSRKVSPKGMAITEQCAGQLVDHGITVVSGYAAGTDLAAHRSALAHGGNTVFVLAEGILKSTRKPEVRELLSASNHVFVSQFLPDQAWSVGSAMRRTSVIIGLSGAMILVESGKSGGTFAAGEESLKLGMPLFVIDYEKPEVSAAANPYFIEKGGQPVRGKNGVPCLSRVFSAVENQDHFDTAEQLCLAM